MSVFSESDSSNKKYGILFVKTDEKFILPMMMEEPGILPQCRMPLHDAECILYVESY